MRRTRACWKGENPAGPGHVRAARSSAGRYLIAYTPTGKPLTVNLDRLSGEKARAWWFSPRTGEAREIDTFATEGTRTFDPPGEEARGNDWVLVVDDAAQRYGKPGA